MTKDKLQSINEFRLFIIVNKTTDQPVSAKYHYQDEPNNPRLFRYQSAAKAFITSHKNQTRNWRFTNQYWLENEFQIVELNCERKS